MKDIDLLNCCGAGGGIRTHAARKGHGLSRYLIGTPGPRPNRFKPVVHLATPAPVIFLFKVSGYYNIVCVFKDNAQS